MSLKKQYNEKKTACKVTFKVPKNIAASAIKINLAGDFNGWNIENLPMKKSKTGDFSITVNLDAGREYQFRYIIDGKHWINEPDADKHLLNEFHTENSIIIV
jgi:1,4-alpha-glucan branching enzyme